MMDFWQRPVETDALASSTTLSRELWRPVAGREEKRVEGAILGGVRETRSGDGQKRFDKMKLSAERRPRENGRVGRSPWAVANGSGPRHD